MSTSRSSILEGAHLNGGCFVCHGPIDDGCARILCTTVAPKHYAGLLQNYVDVVIACGQACADTVKGALNYEVVEHLLSEGHGADDRIDIMVYPKTTTNKFIQTIMLNEIFARISVVIKMASHTPGEDMVATKQMFMGLLQSLRDFYDDDSRPDAVLRSCFAFERINRKNIRKIEELVGFFAIMTTDAAHRTTTMFERAIVEAFERPTCLRGVMVARPVPREYQETEKGTDVYGLICFPVIYERVGNEIIIHATHFLQVHYTLTPS